jgi:predicted nucleic acid-binding Zn ribbon protein
MANYLYVCDNDHARMVTMSVFDTSVYYCDECSLEMWRKPQQYGLSFKGSGFYSKDKSE